MNVYISGLQKTGKKSVDYLRQFNAIKEKNKIKKR